MSNGSIRFRGAIPFKQTVSHANDGDVALPDASAFNSRLVGHAPGPVGEPAAERGRFCRCGKVTPKHAARTRIMLASASRDRAVKVWDATTGQGALTLKGHTGSVSGVGFSPNGKRPASASSDRGTPRPARKKALPRRKRDEASAPWPHFSSSWRQDELAVDTCPVPSPHSHLSFVPYRTKPANRAQRKRR